MIFFEMVALADCFIYSLGNRPVGLGAFKHCSLLFVSRQLIIGKRS